MSRLAAPLIGAAALFMFGAAIAESSPADAQRRPITFPIGARRGVASSRTTAPARAPNSLVRRAQAQGPFGGIAPDAPAPSSPAIAARPVTTIPRATAARPLPARLMNMRQAVRYMRTVAVRESRFQRPGVGYEPETGLTFDGHDVNVDTGALYGDARNASAASKESLDIALLVKVLQGDPTARLLVSPNPRNPAAAVRVAIDRLTRKINSYDSFNRRHPGFGGFLPWFRVAGEAGARQMEPTDDWQNRVPGLDNGQLAWSVYHAEHALEQLGHHGLAARYGAQLDRMRRNVVRIFYDPTRRLLRAEARLLRPSTEAPVEAGYVNNVEGYFLDDAYEGLMMNHFADLLGDWSHQPEGRNAIWREPRREPATYTTRAGQRITVVRAHWGSGHEAWGDLVLPYTDLPVARDLARNLESVRTVHAAESGRPGLAASASAPVGHNRGSRYVSAVGIPGIARQPIETDTVLAPYAAFPIAMVDRPMFATWLRNMLDGPRVNGPHGMVEAFQVDGRAITPVMTWDGKVLPMMAWMGGIRDDVRRELQRDGLYDAFMARVRTDYQRFDPRTIEGRDVPLSAPTAAVPRAMPDYVHTN